MFGGEPPPLEAQDLKARHVKIGNCVGSWLLRGGAQQGGLVERNAMMDYPHTAPVVRQCYLLGSSRSRTSYQSGLVSDTTMVLMRRIDELHLQYPFAEARILRDLLQQKGHVIGWRQVAP